MANFTRVKPPGWGFKVKLLSAEANQLDINMTKAVNGDEGGTWGGPVILTGATLSGTSNVNTSGSIITSTGIIGNTITAVTSLACDTFSSTGSCVFGNAPTDNHTCNGNLTSTNTVQALAIIGTGGVASNTFVQAGTDVYYGSNLRKLTPVAAVRVPNTTPYQTTEWVANQFAGGVVEYHAINGSGDNLCIPVPVPEGSTLTSVAVRVHGGTNNNFPPGAPMKASLWVVDVTTGVATQVGGTISDPFVGASGTYFAFHAITVSGSALDIDRTKERVFVSLESDHTTNGNRFLGLVCTYLLSTVDEIQ